MSQNCLDASDFLHSKEDPIKSKLTPYVLMQTLISFLDDWWLFTHIPLLETWRHNSLAGMLLRLGKVHAEAPAQYLAHSRCSVIDSECEEHGLRYQTATSQLCHLLTI